MQLSLVRRVLGEQMGGLDPDGVVSALGETVQPNTPIFVSGPRPSLFNPGKSHIAIVRMLVSSMVFAAFMAETEKSKGLLWKGRAGRIPSGMSVKEQNVSPILQGGIVQLYRPYFREILPIHPGKSYNF